MRTFDKLYISSSPCSSSSSFSSFSVFVRSTLFGYPNRILQKSFRSPPAGLLTIGNRLPEGFQQCRNRKSQNYHSFPAVDNRLRFYSSSLSASTGKGKGKRAQKGESKDKDSNREDAKMAKLLQAIKQIETVHGKGAVMSFGGSQIERNNVNVISTGSIALDHALGIGGLPRGRIIEIFGPESSGKTTVALHVVREIQRKGMYYLFLGGSSSQSLPYPVSVYFESL